jgi:hypothetical protein
MRDLQALYVAAINSIDSAGIIKVATELELGKAEPVALLRILYASRTNAILVKGNLALVKATLEAAVKE